MVVRCFSGVIVVLVLLVGCSGTSTLVSPVSDDAELSAALKQIESLVERVTQLAESEYQLEKRIAGLEKSQLREPKSDDSTQSVDVDRERRHSALVLQKGPLGSMLVPSHWEFNADFGYSFGSNGMAWVNPDDSEEQIMMMHGGSVGIWYEDGNYEGEIVLPYDAFPDAEVYPLSETVFAYHLEIDDLDVLGIYNFWPDSDYYSHNQLSIRSSPYSDWLADTFFDYLDVPFNGLGIEDPPIGYKHVVFGNSDS